MLGQQTPRPSPINPFTLHFRGATELLYASKLDQRSSSRRLWILLHLLLALVV